MPRSMFVNFKASRPTSTVNTASRPKPPFHHDNVRAYKTKLTYDELESYGWLFGSQKQEEKNEKCVDCKTKMNADFDRI
ncbi:hypothetical protein OESDEN_01772 [Oesophagostomum dentatum]|uniref:Uncharacterized protein n=1 Tax=Oesophagostomum dentatum TaxID=61180 RepID=A0A0B1TLX4_OESDE|nr:hypothetical protein OESDEN_01772 [Oesophagostomum dentatum]